MSNNKDHFFSLEYLQLLMNIETLPEQYYKDLITTPSQHEVSQTHFQHFSQQITHHYFMAVFNLKSIDNIISST